MLQQLARALKLSPLSFYLISGLALLLVGLGLGFALRRVFHRCAERYHERNGWAEFVFALLEALPIPLLRKLSTNASYCAHSREMLVSRVFCR